MKKLTTNILDNLLQYMNKISYIYFFKKIYGLNLNKSKSLLINLGINIDLKLKDISSKKFISIKNFLKNEGINKITSNKDYIYNQNYIIQLGTYKGKRLKAGLPANGQRTHSNGQTSKKLSIKNIKIKDEKNSIIKKSKRQLKKEKKKIKRKNKKNAKI